MRDLPSGTVTFLFTDVEGSTKLLHELGAAEYARALAEHRRVLRGAFGGHGGVEVDTHGDAFFVAFASAASAVEAAAEALQRLAPGPIRVRVGIHTGTPRLTDEGYVGDDVHRAARIAACGHGGQVLISKETRELVDVDLLDLGEHRLKDFLEPVGIFQLGRRRFPPLRTLSNTNLPRPASSFVGREKELREITSLLEGGARLLTLTGPGGSGKTRLAIEAAAALVPAFKAGAFWVDLAPLRDPALVPETISRTLGAKNLANHIGERELLLVLDNLEQVVQAAPGLASLVESCRNLKLIVTSRELLRVKGEVEYPVLPLHEREAVELFCARARTEPDAAVHELCQRLDNLPLALELAAAKTSVLSAKQILWRLSGRLDLLKGGRDADPRQQTLSATIAWSYELIDRSEQSLFARLAVFRGGCTLEAAEEVTEADLDALQSLVEKSLLCHTGERFWMLETIREYAAERLAESGEIDDLRRRHAEHFLALAEEAEPNLRGSPGDWLERLEREHNNLRAALDRLEAAGESELALRLAGALWRFWYLRGHLLEGWRRLDRALDADERPSAVRTKALVGAAVTALNGGNAAAARRRAEEGLALSRELGDVWSAAYSLFMLGNLTFFDSAPGGATAEQLFGESVELFRQTGDEHSVLLATRSLARWCELVGDRERARLLHEDNLRRAHATGNGRIEASTLGELATIAIREGRVDAAIPMLQQSLRIHRGLGDLLDTAIDLCRFANVLALRGRAATAARILSSFAAAGETLGTRQAIAAAMNEETLTAVRKQLDAAAFDREWEQGQALTVDEAVALALAAPD